MGRQKHRCPLWIVLCVFGVANISNGDLQCADSTILCQGSDNNDCCPLDKYCHTGICSACPLREIPRHELLIKCRKMTLKDMNINSEIHLSCLHLCQVYFTLEELNKYLENPINVLVQNYTELWTSFSLESSNNNNTIEKFIGEINYLKQREDEITQLLNQTNLKVVEVQQKESLSTTGDAVKHSKTVAALSIGCCALFLALVLIIVMVHTWRRVIKLEKHPQGVENQDENLQLLPASVNKTITDTVKQKVTLALNPVKLSLQNLETNIKNENIAALRQEIDKVQSENLKLTSSHNELLTSSTKLEKEIADLKKENTTLKAELAEQAATGITLNNTLKEIAEMKQENSQMRLSLEKQEVKVMTMEKELDDLKVKEPAVNNLLDDQLDNVKKELMKLKSKVKLLSQNFNKTETSTEGASSASDLSSDGDKRGEERSTEERAPHRQMASNQGFDSFAATLEKPKVYGVNPHIGSSLSAEYDKDVHTSLTEGES